MNLLYPKIARRDLPAMLRCAALGGCIAGAYGIIQDQLTFSLGTEYFTHFKFRQFAWADMGLPPRAFAGIIGFLAAGWVGACTGWFLARLAVPFATPAAARRLVLAGFACIAGGAVAGGFVGFLLGRSRRTNPDLSNWEPVLSALDLTDAPAFVHVAYVHNAGYLGALAGFIAAGIWIRRARKPAPVLDEPPHHHRHSQT